MASQPCFYCTVYWLKKNAGLPATPGTRGNVTQSPKAPLQETTDVRKKLIANLQKSVTDIEKTRAALEEKRKKLLSRISNLQAQGSQT